MKTITKPLAPIAREKMSRTTQRVCALLESRGFAVSHEGRGCYVYSRVSRAGNDVSGQMNTSDLRAFGRGVEAENARAWTSESVNAELLAACEEAYKWTDGDLESAELGAQMTELDAPTLRARVATLSAAIKRAKGGAK